MGKLVDTDDVYRVLTDYYHHTTELQHMALAESLDRVPEASAIPVIPCKDCNYSIRKHVPAFDYYEFDCKLGKHPYDGCVCTTIDGEMIHVDGDVGCRLGNRFRISNHIRIEDKR